MSETRHSRPSALLRFLGHPLVRLILLGAILFRMMMMNNGFMASFKDWPLLAIGITVCMALAALAVYYAMAGSSKAAWSPNCQRPALAGNGQRAR